GRAQRTRRAAPTQSSLDSVTARAETDACSWAGRAPWRGASRTRPEDAFAARVLSPPRALGDTERGTCEPRVGTMRERSCIPRAPSAQTVPPRAAQVGGLPSPTILRPVAGESF